MSGIPDYIIYTDAATSTRSLSAVISQRDVISKNSGSIFDFCDVSDRERGDIFESTAYILGVEILAILATFFK